MRAMMIIAAILAVAMPAQAKIVTMTYTSDFRLQTSQGWQPNEIMHGTLVYDTDAKPLVSTATHIRIPAISHSVVFQNAAVELALPSPYVEVLRDPSIPVDLFQARNLTALAPIGTVPQNVIVDFGIAMQSSTLSSSLKLPTSTADIAHYAPTERWGFVQNLAGLSLGRPTDITFTVVPSAACEGFDAPLDRTVAISGKGKQAIPLRLQLIDETGLPITGDDTAALPVVEVDYLGRERSPVDGLIRLAPRASTGNEFRWDRRAERWWFNLAAQNFTAPGTYRVSVIFDDGQRALAPPDACVAFFVRP